MKQINVSSKPNSEGNLEISYKKDGILFTSNNKIIVKFDNNDLLEEFHQTILITKVFWIKLMLNIWIKLNIYNF